MNFDKTRVKLFSLLSRGGGGTPSYKLHRYVPPQQLGFWAVLVWKRVHTLPILVWNRVWFSGELWKCMNVSSFQFQVSKKEREICQFKMDLMSK